MEMTRLTRHPKLTIFKIALLLYFASCWSVSKTLADKDVVETSTRNPFKLSAHLRKIALSRTTTSTTTEKPIIIIKQVPEKSTTTPPTTRFPLRKRVSVRVRRIKDTNPEGASSSTSSSLDKIYNREILDEKQENEQNTPKIKRSRETQSVKQQPVSKITGIDQGGKRNPQELIRNALINHTLEHGGEQDLDKLVFSNLPNGSKLVLRTVKIIRTDGEGNPIDGEEGAQPTYWDVTLANATDPSSSEDDEEEDEEEEDEGEETGNGVVDEEEEEEGGAGSEKAASEVVEEKASVGDIASQAALTSTDNTDSVIADTTDDSIKDKNDSVKSLRRRGKKKSDLESAGSHSAANYRHLSDYGATGRDKEHGTTNFHGNTHGNTHKKTYTVTDGKEVKPYQGTEKGYTDYANDHGKSNKDEGERFKTSKKKNKGRKVTGFKRVYHKEEYQRTEHFYDDEEAKKIAESFGLSGAKEADNHGTKDDKRKYKGVRTDYLDGKKVENEHGTHNGYNKGQHKTYKDTQKHSHHSNYGKSQSQSHGSPPQHHNSYDGHSHNDHQNHHRNNDDGEQQQPHDNPQADYHPNHNYHTASYSSPKESTISQLPEVVKEHLRVTHGIPAIVSAPIATSFTVTEYSPLGSQQNDVSVSTPDPSVTTSVFHAFPPEYLNETSSDFQSNPSNQTGILDDGVVYTERRRPFRKRPRERKMFFSPKHRVVNEDIDEPPQNNNEQQMDQNYKLVLSSPGTPVSYKVTSVSDILNSDDNNGQVTGEKETKRTPYAPNFGPATETPPYFVAASPGGGGEYNNIREVTGPGTGRGRAPQAVQPWNWPPRRHRQKRPRPSQQMAYSPVQMQGLLQGQNPRHHHQAPRYPVIMSQNQIHLAGIPFRHASNFHRLGNRHQRYTTLKHNKHQHRHLLHPLEVSTRKSDTIVDIGNGTSPLFDSDSAHYYFNHNNRYAKNHLTSTANPLPSENQIKNNDRANEDGSVRNTLLDPVPGSYSTMVKVLPVTLLNINDSSSQQHSGGLELHHLASKYPAVTQRPLLTAADTISITTAYPQYNVHHQQQQQHHPQVSRPFLPKPRWLTLTMNLANPLDIKMGTEYGDPQRPMGHQSKSLSQKIMRNLKDGILKPFTRGSRNSHNNMPLASPSGISQRGFHRGGPFVQPHMMQSNFHPHPIFAHNMVKYDGMLPLMSTENAQSILTPPNPESTPGTLLAIKSERPKFYYNYKPTNTTDSTSGKTINKRKGSPSPDHQEEQTAQSRYDSRESHTHKPTLKVAKTLVIATSSGSSTDSTTASTMKPEIDKEYPTQTPPPFINGIMDSVAGFFGRMG